MKKSRLSEQQIAFILRQAEEGTRVEEVCRTARTGRSLPSSGRQMRKPGSLTKSGRLRWSPPRKGLGHSKSPADRRRAVRVTGWTCIVGGARGRFAHPPDGNRQIVTEAAAVDLPILNRLCCLQRAGGARTYPAGVDRPVRN